MPHMGKDKLQRQGQLPVTIEVSQDLFDDTVRHLNEVEDHQMHPPMRVQSFKCKRSILFSCLVETLLCQ